MLSVFKLRDEEEGMQTPKRKGEAGEKWWRPVQLDNRSVCQRASVTLSEMLCHTQPGLASIEATCPWTTCCAQSQRRMCYRQPGWSMVTAEQTECLHGGLQSDRSHHLAMAHNIRPGSGSATCAGCQILSLVECCGKSQGDGCGGCRQHSEQSLTSDAVSN